MGYNEQKVDDACLALLQLTLWKDRWATRAWKSMSWDVLDRLYEQGYIHDPRTKAKSVVFTEEGLERSRELFERLFEE